MTKSARLQPRGVRRPLFIVIAMLLLVGLAQWSAPWTDHQIANIVSYVLLAITLGVIAVWWYRQNARHPLRRWLPLAALAVAICGLAAVLKPIGVSGELIPQFRYRFANRPAPLSVAQESVNAAASMVLAAEGFNQFLGPDRNGLLADREFETDLTAHPAKRLWSHPVGAGLAGVAVVPLISAPGDWPAGESASSAPAITDSTGEPTWVCITIEQREAEEWVTCYDLLTGALVWSHAAPGFHQHYLGDIGPRSTPTVDDTGYVYVLGAAGLLRCLDGVSGELVWDVDLPSLAGIDIERSESMVTWGRSASPLVVDDKIVVPLGGDPTSDRGSKSLIALDKLTGEMRWTSGTHQISYASPILAKLAGKRQILSVDESAVSGCDAADGTVLWTSPWPGSSSGAANCSNPVPVGPDQVLVSKGYGGGAKMLRLVRDGERWSTNEVWSSSRVLKTKFTNVVVKGHHGYGLSDGTLQCVDLETGEEAWRQPRGDRFGHGQIVLVEDVIVATTEEGELALVDSDPAEYREFARFQAIEGKTWNPPSVVGNRIVVRNGREMAVWELGRREYGVSP